MVLAAEDLKSIAHLWHQVLLVTTAHWTKVGYEIHEFQFPRSFESNITVLWEVAGKRKNFPRKVNAICGEKKKAYLNSNLASNRILTANFQSELY